MSNRAERRREMRERVKGLVKTSGMSWREWRDHVDAPSDFPMVAKDQLVDKLVAIREELDKK